LERDEAPVQQWLKQQYPKIKALARREKPTFTSAKGRICAYFGKGTHMRSDHHHAGGTWARRQKPGCVEYRGALPRKSHLGGDFHAAI
jgi:hypothetical protein